MKNVGVNEFINVRPESLIITCKEIVKKQKKGYNYTLKKLNDYNGKNLKLTELETKELIDLSKINPKQFIEELIGLHLKEEEIIQIYEGNNYLLPTRFRQFYDRCIKICTENYQIYFNDLAIEEFKDTILKLNERSKLDSLNYVKGKLVEKRVNHLHLSLDEEDEFKKGRSAWYADENELYFHPFKAIYYSVPISKNGNVDVEDIGSLMELMQYFTEYKGLAKCYNYNQDEMVIYYDNGSLKIVGLNKNKSVKEKIHIKANELLKK